MADPTHRTSSILFLAAIAAAAAVSGCSVVQRPPVPAWQDPSAQPGGLCNAVNAQFLLGKTVDQRLAEDAQRRAGARVVRVIRPGESVTMDFSPSRLNLEVDAQGLVTVARCG